MCLSAVHREHCVFCACADCLEQFCDDYDLFVVCVAFSVGLFVLTLCDVRAAFVSGNNIGDAGATALAEALQSPNCQQLTQLNLRCALTRVRYDVCCSDFAQSSM